MGNGKLFRFLFDGINTGHGFICQFVAMPLDLGYTVERSRTGAEKFGGIQVTVFEPRPGKWGTLSSFKVLYYQAKNFPQ